jgi:hypothetical protein
MGAFLIANFGIPEFLRSIPEEQSQGEGGGSIWFKMQGFDWLKKCQFLGQNNHQNSN